MSKSTRNAGKPWTSKDNSSLRSLAKGNTPTRIISLDLGRSVPAIYSQAGKLGIGLKPTNQSPYGTNKKK